MNAQKLYYKYKYEEAANKKLNMEEENHSQSFDITEQHKKLEHEASSGDVESDFVPSWFSEERRMSLRGSC